MRKRSIIGVVLAACILTSASLHVSARQSVAAGYNDTNPGATPCGDGTHAIDVWRSWWIVSGGLIYAKVDIRHSSYCNTIWTRVTNMTGTGGEHAAKFASVRQLTSDEYMGVYNCPKSFCHVDHGWENGDVLPTTGSAGWSHQFVFPSGLHTLPGSNPPAEQPPTYRAIGQVHVGANLYKLDSKFTPVYTQLDNGWDSVPDRITDNNLLTCDNSVNTCKWWGETGTGGPVTVTIRVDASLNTVPHVAGIDLVADVKSVLVPAWNAANAPNAPNLSVCASCSEQILVVGVDPSDPRLGGPKRFASTTGTNNGNFLMTHRTIAVNNNIRDANNNQVLQDHSCGAADDGCLGAHPDDRPLISHEMGHALGLGHCDNGSGVMCHVRADYDPNGNPSNYAEGDLRWVPTWSEVRALINIYN